MKGHRSFLFLYILVHKYETTEILLRSSRLYKNSF